MRVAYCNIYDTLAGDLARRVGREEPDRETNRGHPQDGSPFYPVAVSAEMLITDDR